MTTDGALSPGAQPTELRRHFAAFSETTSSRAPLYRALSAHVAADRDLVSLLLAAPEMQRNPVLLFAAVHALVLERHAAGHDDALAHWYANLAEPPRRPDDPALRRVFVDFVGKHRGALEATVRTRTTQTNEIGRCTLFLPAFVEIADEVGPLAYLDVGASGGLNLLLDRFAYRYIASGRDGGEREELAAIGRPSPVELVCEATGQLRLPTEMPPIIARCGIDRSPIDVTDDGEARWLEACVWPDQADRFHRLVAAIELARSNPPELLAGDAVESIAPAIERMAVRGHPVVTNSWVLNYLAPAERTAYVDELERVGAEVDLSWVFAESPAQTPELPHADDLAGQHLTAITVVRWRGGERHLEHVATSHPHGYWIVAR